MGQLSDVDLLQTADAYFARLNVEFWQCRNPLSNVADAIHYAQRESVCFKRSMFPQCGCTGLWLRNRLA
ncbi:hypothetical protein [Candidatus Aalborgicola defluviihabitans]|uniref:hypothetical protein n=1 Tax=Candidatus Aalborgicola defluviihabitans TaxID=3386187 RepID=UPI0039B82734